MSRSVRDAIFRLSASSDSRLRTLAIASMFPVRCKVNTSTYAVHYTPYGFGAQGGATIEFSADTFRLRFAECLGRLAKAKGWPGNGQVPFAELVTQRSGIVMRQPRISDLLRGTKKPSLQEVEMIALALKVPAGWLAFSEGKQAHVLKRRARDEEVIPVPTPAQKTAAERVQRKGRG